MNALQICGICGICVGKKSSAGIILTQISQISQIFCSDAIM